MHGDAPGGPIRWRMCIPAAVGRVFDLLNTDEGRSSFWAESAIEKNGRISFLFANGYRYEAKVLERTRPQRFALEYFEGVASFELTATAAAATDLLLVHSGVGTEQWNDVHAGWLNVLYPLKAVAAFGVDLRNHDPSRSWDHGYADQ